jgi:glycosyltransferase involved in cell wall biosynthesis
MCKVSIIIPVYNCEKYIIKAIDSALDQSYKNYEIIVVDDGSTDNTLNLITKYDNITVLIKPNGGTASALNCGIRASKGNWIKWLSADDILYSRYLEVMMKCAINPDVIYYCNYERVMSDETTINHFIEPPIRDFKSNKEQFDELMSYFYANGSSSLIHKSVFERFGYFDDTLRHSEDYDMWLRASKNNIRFGLVSEVLLKYRIHPDQLTNKIGGSLDEVIRARYR